HLTACLTLPRAVNATFDIGGPEVLTFGELVAGCAVAAGLPRPVLVPLPVSAPRLTARALSAVLPVDRHLVGPLLESMEHELVCRGEPPACPPPGGPTPYAEAARRALDATPPIIGEHVKDVAAPAAVLWDVITGLGGDTGWYTVPGAWALRGGLDRLFGGVGARRTRPERIEPGAAWDWWRVEEVEPGARVLLRAETRMPGTARLELRAEPDGPRRSRYVQRVLFTPNGLAGRVYWYAQRPAHDLVFGVMARTVAGVAAHRARTDVNGLGGPPRSGRSSGGTRPRRWSWPAGRRRNGSAGRTAPRPAPSCDPARRPRCRAPARGGRTGRRAPRRGSRRGCGPRPRRSAPATPLRTPTPPPAAPARPRSGTRRRRSRRCAPCRRPAWP